MTILGFKIEIDVNYYVYYIVDINEDDHMFWDYYTQMRRENDGFVEDYARSNQHYPKLLNIIASSEDVYENLNPDKKLIASWVWL